MERTLRLWDGYDHTSPDARGLVREVQTYLNRHGSEPVSVDGYFGPRTAAAVRWFQGLKGLLPDGVVTGPTWAALMNRSVPEIFQYETTFPRNMGSLIVELKAARAYGPFIESAANVASVDVAIILGIGSRESGWGTALRPPGPAGTGDFIRRSTVRQWRVGPLPPDGGGFGRGLMQIDFDAHEFARVGPWRDPQSNIAYGASVLADCRRHMHRKYPGLGRLEHLRWSLAAYNCGPGNVDDAVGAGRDADYFTHGRNYGKDVLNRAGWFQLHW